MRCCDEEQNEQSSRRKRLKIGDRLENQAGCPARKKEQQNPDLQMLVVLPATKVIDSGEEKQNQEARIRDDTNRREHNHASLGNQLFSRG